MEGEKTKMAKRQDSRETKANGPLKKKKNLPNYSPKTSVSVHKAKGVWLSLFLSEAPGILPIAYEKNKLKSRHFLRRRRRLGTKMLKR